MTRKSDFKNRVVFLEDYDMNVARYLIQGCDVWLNNPRRPLEASGTSGMKVSVNGGLNFSVLDGWWVEGYQHDNGWAIGAGEEYADAAYQDEVEGRAIYELLEQEIVPTFYNRGTDGVPREWIRRMKRAIRTLVPVFNTNRMVQEYVERCYWPSALRHMALESDGAKAAHSLAEWRTRLARAWSGVSVESVAASEDILRVGRELTVTARIDPAGLDPGDLAVHLYSGPLSNTGDVPQADISDMELIESNNGKLVYRGIIPCESSGQFGYAVRVLPQHALLPHPFESGLVTWG
jgi:starch phosphorylase